MEYGVEKSPKTYKLEDIIDRTRNDRRKLSPCSGAKDWIENPTRFKLREAKHFLDKSQEDFEAYLSDTTDENRDILLFDLGAFISAVRSITIYMQKQYQDKPNFYEWYCPKQIEMKKDSELKFLNSLRVDFIHIKPCVIVTEREAHVGIRAMCHSFCKFVTALYPSFSTQLPSLNTFHQLSNPR
jgi:hypothetical protein